MNSPFSLPIFKRIVVVFSIVSSEPIGRDIRGNSLVETEQVEVIFRVKPTNANLARDLRKATDTYTEFYDAWVIEGDLKLPAQINPGDTGKTEINGKAAIAELKQFAPYSVSAPEEILGQKVILGVAYRSKSNAPA